jgi:2-polyprenyl-3-methyl-5-hydroxy-6-metoxy-1,4-benzoquinol methylase
MMVRNEIGENACLLLWNGHTVGSAAAETSGGSGTAEPLEAMRHRGNEGYTEEAAALGRQYESVRFVDVHAPMLHLFPTVHGDILDIGAGTGRDAAALAGMGHRVVAVEPTAAFREQAAILHPSPRIEWVNDSLPRLARITARGERFDVVMLTAVWIHLDARQRREVMPRLASLLRPGGALLLTLRHGPAPPGRRRVFETSADETIALAHAQGLGLAVKVEHQADFYGRPEVTWTSVAFRSAEST